MYTPGNISFLGSKPRPFEVVGTLTIFSVLALVIVCKVLSYFYLVLDQNLQIPEYSLQAGESNNLIHIPSLPKNLYPKLRHSAFQNLLPENEMYALPLVYL